MPFQKVFLSIIFFFSLTGFVLFFGKMIGISYVFLTIVSIGISFLVHKKLRIQSSSQIPLFPFIGFTLVSMFVMNSFMVHQRFSDAGISFQQFNAHDTWWHITLMKSLQKSVPPENPVYAGTQISGYHYFTDIVWVGIHSIFRIPVEVLYVWISPLLLSSLLALSTVLVTEVVSKDWKVRLLTSVLALWGSGLAWYTTFIFHQARSVDSMFWLDQSVQYGINHQLMLSLTIGNVLLWNLFSSKKVPWWFTGILSGSLAGIKVYAFLLYFPILGLIALYHYFQKKEKILLSSFGLAFFIAGSTLFFNRSALGFPFIWLPGWFVKTMFESGDHLNFPTWEIHRQLFSQTQNYPRVFIHWSWATVLFLIGNFGVKILGIFSLGFLLTKKHSLQYTKVVSLFLLTILSILIPMLFIQKGVVWNTIQFMHFAQIPLTLLFVLFIQHVVKKKGVQIVVLIVVILLSLPTTLMTIVQNFDSTHYIHYDNQTIQELRSLSQYPEDIQIFVGSMLHNSSIIPALSGRNVQWSDPTVLSILGIVNEERLFDTTYWGSQVSLCSDTSVHVHDVDTKKVFVQDCQMRVKN